VEDIAHLGCELRQLACHVGNDGMVLRRHVEGLGSSAIKILVDNINKNASENLLRKGLHKRLLVMREIHETLAQNTSVVKFEYQLESTYRTYPPDTEHKYFDVVHHLVELLRCLMVMCLPQALQANQEVPLLWVQGLSAIRCADDPLAGHFRAFCVHLAEFGDHFRPILQAFKDLAFVV
jgi:hypothetical protein